MSRVTLTPSEVRASDGALCWRSKHNGPLIYGRACSLEFGHRGDHRHDMTIKQPTWTRERILTVMLPSAACSLAFGMFVGWLTNR